MLLNINHGAVETAASPVALQHRVFSIFVCILLLSWRLIVFFIYPMDILNFKAKPGAGCLTYSREELLALKTKAQAVIWHHIPAELKRRFRGCKAGAQHVHDGSSSCTLTTAGVSQGMSLWRRTCTVRDLELLAVGLRPYYLPREYSPVITICVYIPPRADAPTTCDK